jgi:hypothetical protein
MFASVNRIVNHNFEFIDNEHGITFEVFPGDAEVAAGDKLNIVVTVSSNKPEYNFKIDELEFYTKQITADGYELLSDPKLIRITPEGNFKTTIENINSELLYFAQYKSVKSEEYRIEVSEYPIVKSFNIKDRSA